VPRLKRKLRPCRLLSSHGAPDDPTVWFGGEMGEGEPDYKTKQKNQSPQGHFNLCLFGAF